MMTKRSERPSEYRCLIGLVYGLSALLMVRILNKLNESLCAILDIRSTLQECSPVPADWIGLLYWVAAVGCVFTCYRAYRDFYVGDYYLDLMK